MEITKLDYPNKTVQSINSKKFGSRDFLQIANDDLN